MRFTISMLTTLITLLGLQLPLLAQHTRYKLIDLGTFGGPSSYIAPSEGGGPGNPTRALTNNGVVVGAASTDVLDPFLQECADCFAQHAFQWHQGVLTDLGTLGGNNRDLTSVAHWINDRGWVAGFSQTGGVDSFTGAPAGHPVLWVNGEIFDLGTLGEEFATATALNNTGQVVGFSFDGVPDPISPFFNPTESRAFLWHSGVMQDLGTLGGVDAGAFAINEAGQVAGISATNTTRNDTTGIPTVHPFLWDRGRMIDLGALGGTLSGVDGPTILLNNRGQVAGTSTLAGDTTYHPFLWEHGLMRDLGTLGGDTGFVTWITDAGDVMGTADLPGPPGNQSHHAFLWRNGVMTDLGSLGTSSHAEGMNSHGQIVGRYRIADLDNPRQHAFFWENNGPMVDLNTLIPPNSGLELEEGGNINNSGEIAGRGFPAGCDDIDACGHAFLLIPCVAGQTCENESAAGITRQNSSTLHKSKSSHTQTQTNQVPALRARALGHQRRW